MRQDIFSILEEGYTEPIRDPLWGHIYLTPGLADLTKSEPFLRLTRILQLGPTFLAYPGATHTRAAHSIGVYHLARRLIRSLAEKGADGWLSPGEVLSFLAAALLHDLGHFPYTHSLKELPLEDHEALTGRIVLSAPFRDLLGQAGADPYLTAAIVDTSLPIGGNEEAAFYRKLLSGVLDPDKLDYLNRDARYCGVPYGAQDVDFTFSRLSPHRERGADIDGRGIPNVEAILFAKYLMYRSVYQHRTVRSATAMMKKAVMAGLNSGDLAAEELYGLDDQGLFALLAARRHPLFALADRVRRGALFETLAELPVREEGYGRLSDLSQRKELEEEFARRLGDALGRRIGMEEILIDLPESVSLETGLYVADEEAFFSDSSTVFGRETVAAFAGALRILRIFAVPELSAAADDSPPVRELLRESAESLHLY